MAGLMRRIRGLFGGRSRGKRTRQAEPWKRERYEIEEARGTALDIIARKPEAKRQKWLATVNAIRAGKTWVQPELTHSAELYVDLRFAGIRPTHEQLEAIGIDSKTAGALDGLMKMF